MTAPTLSVNDNGTWKAVVEPYVRDGDVWKTIHNVWIRDANTWKLAHKTPPSRYGLGNLTTWVAADVNNAFVTPTYTVPDNGTRYIDVTIRGQGGGGGGGVGTSGHASGGRHYECPFDWNTTLRLDLNGGAGGFGGFWYGAIEVRAGDQFVGEFWYPDTNTGGSGYGHWYLPQNGLGVDVDDSQSGGTGVTGQYVKFKSKRIDGISSSYKPWIDVTGGAGGPGGSVTVTSKCIVNNPYTYGYGTSYTSNVAGANGTFIITANQANNIAETYQTGVNNVDSGVKGYGASGNGGKGGTGSIQILERT